MSLAAGTLSQAPAVRPAAAAMAAFLAGIAGGVWLRGSGDTMSPPVQVRAERAVTMGAGHPAAVLRVIDGDTFDARVEVWPGIEITTKVRLRNVDAPEMKAKCSAERTKAEAARDALARMLGEGGVTVSQVGLDKYGGRVDATVSTRFNADVGEALVKAGLARPYGGGRRQGWC